MALPDVAPLLAKDFVPLMLDFDRAIGAKDIEKTYIDKEQGLPWFVFVDGDGKGVINSTGPKGNVGMPWEPHEVEHFGTMLTAAKKKLTDAEVAYLIKSIQDFRKKAEAGGGG